MWPCHTRAAGSGAHSSTGRALGAVAALSALRPSQKRVIHQFLLVRDRACSPSCLELVAFVPPLLVYRCALYHTQPAFKQSRVFSIPFMGCSRLLSACSFRFAHIYVGPGAGVMDICEPSHECPDGT